MLRLVRLNSSNDLIWVLIKNIPRSQTHNSTFLETIRRSEEVFTPEHILSYRVGHRFKGIVHPKKVFLIRSILMKFWTNMSNRN